MTTKQTVGEYTQLTSKAAAEEKNLQELTIDVHIRSSDEGQLKTSPISQIRRIMTYCDLENISPIQMAELSNLLYARGIIEFDEYAVLSFQPELNPEKYLAINGVEARPFEPRNIIQELRDKLARLRNGKVESTPIEKEKLGRAVDLLNYLQSFFTRPS